ncbi:hypothetical protein PhCBS80983_g05952 [Powellomyces hirtus]|uniref:Ubiquitin-like domain-containing protein n=1 Tax=Powellomyces hirtus TaxID=109895 RepID=A0A507DSF2_9FUNG|nr:hypothetical protein PhCBS80983_g05952 [Powellomyces hirtus]
MSTQQMYVRIKHHKKTYFIECAPTGTVATLKAKLATQAAPTGHTTDVKLHIAGKVPGTYAALEDAAVLEQVGIADDAVLYAAFWVPGESAGTGSWEPIQVPDFEPLHDDPDDGADTAEDMKGKGKAAA